VSFASLDDEALLRLIIQRQTEALNTLYDRYSRLVYSLAFHTVGDPETAEEITQDVFFRVWEKAGTYRSEQAKVSTWITSITRYRAIDLLRQRAARPEKDSLGWDEVPGSAEPSVDSPEEATELSIEGGRLRSALAVLPVDQRQALELAYFQGLSHSEIAERLSHPLGTVKTRIRLAMQKLREVLQDDPVLPSG
jgi:RNA polymerase sigma-70 factor (ECF subfamily)